MKYSYKTLLEQLIIVKSFSYRCSSYSIKTDYMHVHLFSYEFYYHHVLLEQLNKAQSQPVIVTVTTSLQCGKLYAHDGLCVYVRRT